MSKSLLVVLMVSGLWALPGCSRAEAPTHEGAGAATATVAAVATAAVTAKPGVTNTTSGRIEIAVTADGFVPSQTRIKVGQPMTLVVTRKVAKTCATEIVIKDYGVNKKLPQDQPVEVTFTPTKPGPIRYACGMDMVAGELVAVAE